MALVATALSATINGLASLALHVATPPSRTASVEAKKDAAAVAAIAPAPAAEGAVTAAAAAAATGEAVAVASTNFGASEVPIPPTSDPTTLPAATAPATAAAEVAAAAAAPAPVPPAPPAPTTVCGLCGEAKVLQPVGIQSAVEQWYKTTLCDHQACGECLRQWIKVAVDDGAVFVRCPLPDCAFRLYPGDIQRLAEPPVMNAFRDLLAATYRRRQEELSAPEADAEMREYIENSTKSCPVCRVVIERYEGCNYMVCTCGTEFCYQCGLRYDDIEGSCECG